MPGPNSAPDDRLWQFVVQPDLFRATRTLVEGPLAPQGHRRQRQVTPPRQRLSDGPRLPGRFAVPVLSACLTIGNEWAI